MSNIDERIKKEQLEKTIKNLKLPLINNYSNCFGMMPKYTCKWEKQQKFDNCTYYDTSCNNTIGFDSGDAQQNGHKYCYKCGREIEEIE